MIFNQDCISGMREHVEDGSIDLIFTDPPYGIDGDKLDAHYHRDESFVVPGYIDVPRAEYTAFSQQWIAESVRCLRPGGSMYVVSGYTNLIDIISALKSTEMIEVNHLIAKYTFGVNTTKKWVSSHYHVLYWVKPPKAKTSFNTFCRFSDTKDSYNDRLSVQDLPRDYRPGQIKNKNQLSESFIEKFILYSSSRGDTVLDPFLGGFTTARTAKRFGRVPMGFELNTNAYDAFLPSLAAVEVLPDPAPIEPEEAELAKRERQRGQWKKDRQRRKGATTIIVGD